jgi:putative spermidine/putrescine transport system permease protein
MNAYCPGWSTKLLAVLIAIFLLAPLLAVVPISFTPVRYLSLPHGAWSLRHYRTLVTDPDWVSSILLSLQVGLCSAIIATTLATAFALGIWYARPRFAPMLVGFTLLPMVVPPVVSAVTLYFLMTTISQVAGPLGYDTWPGVVLCHVVMIVPFAVVVVLVSLSQLDRRIEMAARGFGASVWRITFAVILPSIRFGVLSAAFLSFILSWEEIAVTLFVTSVDAITLPRRIWMGLRDNVNPAVAAISVVFIVLVVAILAARLFVRGRRAAPQSA